MAENREREWVSKVHKSFVMFFSRNLILSLALRVQKVSKCLMHSGLLYEYSSNLIKCSRPWCQPTHKFIWLLLNLNVEVIQKYFWWLLIIHTWLQVKIKQLQIQCIFSNRFIVLFYYNAHYIVTCTTKMLWNKNIYNPFLY